MPRYVALLRGVSPMNAKMPELKRCFEQAGFTDVRTVLSSGNVLFSARAAADSTLARKAEQAMEAGMGRSFFTIVRSVAALREIVESDPYAGMKLSAAAKRVVTFLAEAPKGKVTLPAEVDGARIVRVRGGEVFTAYVPSPRGPVFMTVIEKTFGKDITTRTLDTVKKLAADAPVAAAKSSSAAAARKRSASAKTGRSNKRDARA